MPGERISDGDTYRGMTNVARRVHGPRPIAALVPEVARNAFHRSAPGIAQLLEAWPAIIGPALAQLTTPRRLSQGTLTIGCSGPVAMELQHLASEVLARINQFTGTQAVRRLRFIQIAPARNPVRLKLRPVAAIERAAVDAVAELPDGPLRTALTALGRAVFTESASRLGNQTHTKD